jgi:hypothetical protein
MVFKPHVQRIVSIPVLLWTTLDDSETLVYTINSNRDTRNEKKKERMATLRAARAQDSADQVEARCLTACESARRYREKCVFICCMVIKSEMHANPFLGIGNSLLGKPETSAY